MKLTFGCSKFKIRILYKSGNSIDHWFTKFTTTQDLSRAEWKTAEANEKPLVMGIDHVEAVWQVDYRINFFWFLWANTFGLFTR